MAAVLIAARSLGGHDLDSEDDAAEAAAAEAAAAAAHEHRVAGLGLQPGHLHPVQDEQQSR